MNSKAKWGLIIVGGLAVVGTGLYFISKNASEKSTRNSGSSSEGSSDSGSTSGSSSNNKSMLDFDDPKEICSGQDNWKARGALAKGLYIPDNWTKRYDDQTNCEILNWMYELKFRTGKNWAGDYSLKKLIEAAEYQLHEQKNG